ncbi:mammalian cell entry protein [Mycolicibacterium mucogenicum]|uniref:Mammalian cell entry protein n=1 Tax=Mycolicibacterium mucogenicum TaxID=56689 RepID=A0A1A3HCP3_MYCMU|nr:MCE family protein [Mycolicibacterium mucogenicum]OBJ45444.1 mammalian cell entry protein [Mycolicibacterium mucogenicum]
MRERLRGIVWRLGIFLTVCALALFATVVVFGQFRFKGGASSYNALFTNVTGLRVGNMVRAAGVEVGKVTDITVNRDSTVHVAFTADSAAILNDRTRAEIRYDDLIGGRYLSLVLDENGAAKFQPGQMIPLERTKPALDLESVTGGFRPLFKALSPQQLNDLSGQLMAALDGQGPSISSLLDRAAAATNTLADHDTLIGQVITNLNVVLGSIGGQADQLDKTVTSLSGLVHSLAARKTDIANAVASTNTATGTIADLLARTREPIKNDVQQTDRVAGNVLLDHEYFDHILDTLPDAYQKLNRQGIYGDYFSFYFCDVVLKLNGKGGQPVYVKVAGQDSGRCTPK